MTINLFKLTATIDILVDTKPYRRMVLNALKNAFEATPEYLSVIWLDTKWDEKTDTLSRFALVETTSQQPVYPNLSGLTFEAHANVADMTEIDSSKPLRRNVFTSIEDLQAGDYIYQRKSTVIRPLESFQTDTVAYECMAREDGRTVTEVFDREWVVTVARRVVDSS